VAENVSEPIMLLDRWGTGMDPTTLGLEKTEMRLLLYPFVYTSWEAGWRWW
jgi:hypothetical protein